MSHTSAARSSVFPNDFSWGAASAAYQVEGAAFEDGKGPSIWDVFCRQPGRIFEGNTGEKACDHYHRYREDVALMKQIGLKAYRLSVSWPRVLPAGTGAINKAGLAFYDRLIDELLGAGIEPWVTLFHWDMPFEIFCRGGWLNRDIAGWFADYTAVVVDRLSDRVSKWMTLNEPQVFIGLGMESGIFAPGDRRSLPEVLRASHHALLAHGRAAQVIRARAKLPAQIGWAPVGVVGIPATSAPADIAAARSAMFSIRAENVLVNPIDASSTWCNTWWNDPVVFGAYPEDGVALFQGAMPPIAPGDMETINQAIDFFGVNIYHGRNIKAGKEGVPEWVPREDGFPTTSLGFPVTPDALYWGPKFLYEQYKKPLVITENGTSGRDWVSLDGCVHDPQRIDFLERYLRALARACAEGVDVRGYFQWSIMDNFEWASGYKERFGLIHVDYRTQKRTLKDSAYWYRDLIAGNGASLRSQ